MTVTGGSDEDSVSLLLVAFTLPNPTISHRWAVLPRHSSCDGDWAAVKGSPGRRRWWRGGGGGLSLTYLPSSVGSDLWSHPL